jgi:hypothetical protein
VAVFCRLLDWARRWRAGRRARRAATGALDRLFADPANLSGTSLRSVHRARVEAATPEFGGDQTLVAVRFAVVRHPRMFAFSRQFHQVLEHYRYELATGRVERTGSVDITRLSGRDADGAL